MEYQVRAIKFPKIPTTFIWTFRRTDGVGKSAAEGREWLAALFATAAKPEFGKLKRIESLM
jgi:hypothetical protein